MPSLESMLLYDHQGALFMHFSLCYPNGWSYIVTAIFFSGPITFFLLKYDLYNGTIHFVMKYLGCYWAGTPSKVMLFTHF